MQHHAYDLLQNFLPNSKTFWEVSSRLPPLIPPLAGFFDKAEASLAPGILKFCLEVVYSSIVIIYST